MLTRSECRLIRHAINQDWPVPVSIRPAIMHALMQAVTGNKAEESRHKHRLQIAAVQAVLAADNVTIRIMQARRELLRRTGRLPD